MGDEACGARRGRALEFLLAIEAARVEDEGFAVCALRVPIDPVEVVRQQRPDVVKAELSLAQQLDERVAGRYVPLVALRLHALPTRPVVYVGPVRSDHRRHRVTATAELCPRRFLDHRLRHDRRRDHGGGHRKPDDHENLQQSCQVVRPDPMCAGIGLVVFDQVTTGSAVPCIVLRERQSGFPQCRHARRGAQTLIRSNPHTSVGPQ